MRDSTKQAWAAGGLIFAATMMVIVGIFQVLEGIVGIVQGGFFIVGPNYTYNLNTTAWGWIHLGIGVVLAVTGVFLYTGAIWARVLGIAVASVSAIANFFFVPYYPFWSLLIIALDVYLIWAIATARPFAEVGMEEAATTRGEMYAGEAGRTPAERWPAAKEPAAGRWEAEPSREAPGMGQGAPGGRGEYSQEEAARRAAEEAQRRSRR